MTDLKLMGHEEFQRLMAAVGQQFTEPLRILYKRTRNPIHALSAYRLSRALKIDVPCWVLELFDQWAEVLCVNPPKGGKAKIADALGLGSKGGGPSITLQTKTQTRDLAIAQEILGILKSKKALPMLDIFHEVAEKFSLSSDSVANIWYELTRETDPDP